MKLKFVEWGVANRFGNTIEIHKDLKKYPRLYKPILQHELKHTDKYSLQDFKADFLDRVNLNRWEFYKFMLKRPKTWIQFLPFYYQPSKGFVYDINKIFFYIFALTIVMFWIFLLIYFKIV